MIVMEMSDTTIHRQGTSSQQEVRSNCPAGTSINMHSPSSSSTREPVSEIEIMQTRYISNKKDQNPHEPSSSSPMRDNKTSTIPPRSSNSFPTKDQNKSSITEQVHPPKLTKPSGCIPDKMELTQEDPTTTSKNIPRSCNTIKSSSHSHSSTIECVPHPSKQTKPSGCIPDKKDQGQWATPTISPTSTSPHRSSNIPTSSSSTKSSKSEHVLPNKIMPSGCIPNSKVQSMQAFSQTSTSPHISPHSSSNNFISSSIAEHVPPKQTTPSKFTPIRKGLSKQVAEKTSTITPRSSNSTHSSSQKVPRWKELARMEGGDVEIVTVSDIGMRKTTRRKRSRSQEKKTSKLKQEEMKTKMTTPIKVKTASNIQRRARTPGGSPRSQKVKRLASHNLINRKPETISRSLTAKDSRRNFSSLLSRWEHLSTSSDSVLTSASLLIPRSRKSTDGQSQQV